MLAPRLRQFVADQKQQQKTKKGEEDLSRPLVLVPRLRQFGADNKKNIAIWFISDKVISSDFVQELKCLE